jgi:hypothetical protein
MLHKRLMAIGILGCLMLTCLATIPVSEVPVKAQGTGSATTVQVGIYLISFGNYDANKGTYTLDFYIWFRYNVNGTAADFTIEKFEFMNGRAGSTSKLSSVTKDGVKEVWYRIQANLYANPMFKMYPFDKQKIVLQMEDAISTTSTLVYQPLSDESGIDPALSIAGWNMDQWSWTSDTHGYNFGSDHETYSRLTFEIDISRAPTSTTIKTLLPPIIFCIVSCLSFFFPSTKMAQKIGLGTSMLISAVMFHISQISSLPPMGSLIMIDKIMLSTYGCLCASLICTALVSVNDDFWKKADLSKKINMFGGIMSVILPFIIFGGLWFL